jgi:hypothetical protein
VSDVRRSTASFCRKRIQRCHSRVNSQIDRSVSADCFRLRIYLHSPLTSIFQLATTPRTTMHERRAGTDSGHGNAGRRQNCGADNIRIPPGTWGIYPSQRSIRLPNSRVRSAASGRNREDVDAIPTSELPKSRHSS